MSRYDYNETMKMLGHHIYDGELKAVQSVIQAYAAETTSGKIYTNISLAEMLMDAYALGEIHGIRKERRRRHNAGKEMR